MFKNKKILVVGLGVSGIAAVKALDKLGAVICACDDSPKEKLAERLKEIENIDVEYHLGGADFSVEDIDLAVKSPGIKYETPVVQKLLKSNIKVISDIEAAYMITKGIIVSISGTNGKTTTTTLIGEIVKESGRKFKVTGNIGYGMFNDALNAEEGEILVAEVSSFQLAGTEKYKPHISILTNITPDHMDYHHTMENYIEAKFRNVINQDENDFAVLNYEDKTIREYSKSIKAEKIFFSADRPLDEGIFVEGGKMYYRDKNRMMFIIDTADIFIPGRHNVENALAAAGAAVALKIEPEKIARVLRTFKGVEHRLEFTAEYNGVKFYNDSKGTNPDSSIKAVEGIEKPIILIAGGYDKHSEYDEFIKAFNGKVKALVLLGQTARDIEKCARKYGFNDIYMVSSMDEAVKKSFELSESGDTVLLSPACASWGMYPNYEVRGRDFKERVKYYGGCCTQSQ
jgi:UDP-N-acetylmuramoylalanine--D-glutamate ligase